MAIGFYDYDLKVKPTKLLLNLEAMKIASYYNKLGKTTTLLENLDTISECERTYLFRNLMSKNVLPHQEKKINSVLSDRTEHYGLAYSNGIYVPMTKEFEEQVPYIQLYSPYLREKVTSDQLTFSQIEKILDSHFIRLRAGTTFEIDLSKLKKKQLAFIYDSEITQVNDWEKKLLYIKQDLTTPLKIIRIRVVNGFNFYSFEDIRKFSKLPGFGSDDVHLFTSDTYKEFKEQFNSIADWSSSRDGIKYSFGHDINPANNNEVIRSLCLSINKYFYTKSILKACEFIVADNCEISPLNKLQKDFQYWTGIRVGDQTLKEYYIGRNKKSFDEYYSIIAKTPYKSQFDSLCGKTKNEIRKTGWYYHE